MAIASMKCLTELGVSQYLPEQSPAQLITAMHRHRDHPPVRVKEPNVTAALAHHLEARPLQYLEHPFPGQERQGPAHTTSR